MNIKLITSLAAIALLSACNSDGTLYAQKGSIIGDYREANPPLTGVPKRTLKASGGNDDKFTSNKGCAYGSIESPAYSTAGALKPAIHSAFFHNPRRNKRDQQIVWRAWNAMGKQSLSAMGESSGVSEIQMSPSVQGMLNTLTTHHFKVRSVGVIAREDTDSRRLDSDHDRYYQEPYNGKFYKRDRAFSTAVITSNCKTFYFAGDTSKEQLLELFVKADGGVITDDDILNIYGRQSVTQVMAVDIEYDKFNKRYKVATPSYDGKFLRGWIDSTTLKVVAVQLYAEIAFKGKWGHISNATDIHGNSHEVTRITSDVDSCGADVGCTLHETVGVTLSHGFLYSNIKGFELQLEGLRSQVIEIPEGQIRVFLDSIDEALAKAKAGDTQ